MEQHTGSQYDDDLTVGMDEYDDSLQTGNVDLFEFVGDEESPITRLKTIILSIDWEISDDILRQFNTELLDLKDIWANEKINLVYVQALEKISKYIYQEKADANPNAIKLLLNFYSNLEKIVSTGSMPEEEKKRLLMEDVEKFEKLKKQISRSSGKPSAQKTTSNATFKTAPAFRTDEPLPTDGDNEDPLLNLKAIVFGMDWEITEADLNNLGEEVRRLEKRFINSKAKLIFLQGIGALGAYINLKKSNAHADAFKLLHSFFLSLENCVRNGLAGEEEKRLLMPEVEKFNAFKAAIAFTISPEAIAAEGEGDEDLSVDSSSASNDIAPAFADLPEEVHGFQEEEEAASLGSDAKQKVDGQIDKFFNDVKIPSGDGVDSNKSDLIGEMESRLQGFFGDDLILQQQSGETSEDIALKGVIVETEADDDSAEEALPRLGDELAPALSENFEESSFSEKAIAGELGETESSFEMEDRVAGIFDAPDETQTIEDISAALQGVEVETEADDDSDEEPLPRRDEELAPALFSLDDHEEIENAPEKISPSEESNGIEGQLAEFFSDTPEPIPAVDDQIALEGVDVGTEEEEAFSDHIVSSKEEFSAAVYSLEEDTTEEIPQPSLFQEETEPEVDDRTQAIIVDDSIKILSDGAVGEALLGIDIEPVKDTDVENLPHTYQDVEQATTISESEENLFFNVEENLPEENLSLDFEDHLKEFFEDEVEVIAIKEEPVIDFSEGLSETEKDTVSDTAELFSLVDEESSPDAVEMEEDINILDEEHTLTKEPADVGSSLVFEADEEGDGSPESMEEIVFEYEESSVFEAAPEEETREFLADAGESESDADFEKVEEISFAEDATAEPVFNAVKEEPADTSSVLQENEDFIDYIEGVEFDIEEESLGAAIEPVDKPEEVIFEAVDEGSISEGVRNEEITFDAIEEELDKYFTEQDDLSERGDRATEKLGETNEFFEDAETFGQGFEAGPVGTKIQTDMLPKTPDSEKFHVSEGLASLFTEDRRLPGTRGLQSDGFVVPEREIRPAGDNDPLTNLRGCIASLGLEIDDSNLGDLFNEVNTLRNLWITQPAEKTFLQLLSTVAQHIDHNRHESSPEAYGLLMSVFDKLELSRLPSTDRMEAQENLLSETTKVLLWQQKMLTRKAAEHGEDFSVVFEAVDDDAEVDEFQPSSSFKQEMPHDRISPLKEGITPSPEGESDMIKKRSVDVDTEKITRIVKDELAMLRQSFRSEMADLLQQYFDKNK